MGTWGSGIFDNDTASDVISDVVSHLLDLLKRDVATIDEGVFEREGPAVAAILVALERSLHEVQFSIVEYDVPGWVATYKQWIASSEYVSVWFDPEKAKASAAAISEVFDELLEIWEQATKS